MHPLKVFSSIFVTSGGIDISSNFSQSQNADLPIKNTEEGMSICANELHLLKANDPIKVTERGIEISVREEHSEKVY